MNTPDSSNHGRYIHVVTLECKDQEHAARCLAALTEYGRPDALACHCLSYDFGLKEGTTDTVCLVERWNSWEDLNTLLQTKVIPALPTYNELLRRPFDPARDTVRITLSDG